MRKLITLLQFAYKSGEVKFGYENLKKVRGNYVVLAATDLSEKTKKDILLRHKGKVYFCFTKGELSKIFGKNNIGVVLVKQGNIGKELKNVLDKTEKEAFIEEHYSKTVG